MSDTPAIVKQHADRLDGHDQVLDGFDRRLVVLESAVEAQRSGMDGIRTMLEFVVQNEQRQTGRIQAIRDTLSTHEREEREQREQDLRYRRDREDAERRAAVTARLSMFGILATFAAVVLGWWLGKI